MLRRFGQCNWPVYLMDTGHRRRRFQSIDRDARSKLISPADITRRRIRNRRAQA